MAALKNTDEKLSIKVHGFDILSDTIYKVVPKLDTQAPDGFIAHETTKILNPEIGTSVPMAVWDEDRGVWDTGLHENSKILVRLYPEPKSRAEVLKGLKKFIIDPVEAIKGRGVLSHIQPKGEESFWDNNSTNLVKDLTFSTSNPMDLLSIYSAVLHGNLAPKEMEESPIFRNKAQFAVQNIEQVVDLKQRKDLEKNEAIGLFFTMLTQNKEDLLVILDYLGIPSTNNPDKAALNSVFTEWLNNKENGYQNASIFVETYEFFQSKDGKEELKIFSTLKDLLRKQVIKRKMGAIYLDDLDLGANLKLAAKRAVKSEEIQELIFNKLT
jgi:hypothetical protein